MIKKNRIPACEIGEPEDNLNRIRILHVISDLSLAGAEMKLYKLLTFTNRKRFAPTVISMRDRGELRARIEELGIPVYTLGVRGSLPGPVSVLRLIRLVRQLRPDLIHGWMYHGNLAAQFAGMFTRRRAAVLWSIHQSLYTFVFEKRLTTFIIKLCARISGLPDKVIYNSKTSAAQHESVGYRKDKRVVLYYGFDTEKFAPSIEARREVRCELGLARDAILVGLAGRYHPIKDHSNFLLSAALLVKKYPNVRFVLCGKGVDGTNRSLLMKIRELGLTDFTYLLGERRDIERVIASLDIAVSSSYSEGFPNVVGEAMSSGVPCVVTEVSDLPEIVGTTGRMVPPRNARALARAIESLLAIGPERRRELGAAGRARIIERYSLDASVMLYESAYDYALALSRLKQEDQLRPTPALGNQVP